MPTHSGLRSARSTRNHAPRPAALAYCVRVCDGRFFPVKRHGGVTPSQACSSFCPASQTKIYHGSSIDHAVGQDGKRYAELSTAFVYREKIVAGCTCNGKDAFGLVNTSVENDPTLRPGDIVATNSRPYGLQRSPADREFHSDQLLFRPFRRFAPQAHRDQDHAGLGTRLCSATPRRIIDDRPVQSAPARTGGFRPRGNFSPPPQAKVRR